MLCDSHTHSRFSFDGHDSVADMCRAAIAQDVDAFAVTDHYDIDGILDGFYPDLDTDGAAREIAAAQDMFCGKVRIVRGVELGQPGVRPEEAKEFLHRNRFDFVIASCHNLAGVPDFSFLDYTEMPDAEIADLYRRMLADLTEYAAFPGIHTVAHLTYPLRYIAKCGRSLDLTTLTDEFSALFRSMKEHGAALEINVKGIRTGFVSPDDELRVLRWWREAGGEDVTVGSDAHYASEIGARVRDGYALAAAAGFTRIAFPENGKMSHHAI